MNPDTHKGKIGALVLMVSLSIPGDCRADSLAFAKLSVSIPAGTGSLNFGTAIDFDSDGNLDVVLTRAVWPPTYPATYASAIALRNVWHGQFTNATASVLGGLQTVHARDLRPADFDGDGRMDLFIADHGTDVSPFPGGQSLLLTQTADGRLRNDTATRLPQLSAFSHHATVGDVDGDLDPDIYLANIWNNTQVGPLIYINDGAGTFTTNNSLPQPIVSLQNRYTAGLLFDADGDGDLDLALGGHAATEDHDRLLLNDGHGNFTYAPLDALPPRHGSASWETIDIASADFDGDGWPDLIMCEETNYNQPFLQLLLNNHDGTFRDASTNIVRSWPAPANNNWIPFVRVVDLDGDGDLDFVCHLFYGAPQIFLNDGTGVFTSANQLFPSGTPTTVLDILPGDFDGDGNPDLFVLGASQAALLRNLLPPKNGSYSPAKTNQAIIFPRIGKQDVTNGSVVLNATASSGLPVSYEVRSGPAMVSGNVLNFTGAGAVTLLATQSGNAMFNAAVPVEQRLVVTGPPSLNNCRVVSNQFGFDITGEPNQVIVLETSPNLANWIPLATNTLRAKPLPFSDPDSGNLEKRFYRARLP